MVSKEVTVKSATGLHARPATLLVKKASSFKSDVSIEFDGKKANIKTFNRSTIIRCYKQLKQ